MPKSLKLYMHLLMYAVTVPFRWGPRSILETHGLHYKPQRYPVEQPSNYQTDVIFTYRDFEVLPFHWRSKRPRRGTLYLRPELPKKTETDPARRAINGDGPCEYRDPRSKGPYCADCYARADWMKVAAVVQGERVHSVRHTINGGRCESDYWAYVRVPVKFLRGDLPPEIRAQVKFEEDGQHFYAYTPAIWLASAPPAHYGEY